MYARGSARPYEEGLDGTSPWVRESVAYGSLRYRWRLSYTVDRYHAFQPYMLCYANT